MASSADILFLPGANANAPDGHPTYFSLHHVHEAHALTKGVDVKVGVIDWFFGADTHASLYAGCRNFTGEPAFLQGEGHGLWMASALREMAPECEIYALCVDARGEDEARRCRLLMDAMAWAADNGIQILTYSNAPFAGEQKALVGAAIEGAVNAGLITAFIHTDHPQNIWPYGCFPYHPNPLFDRAPDVNICHFDYAILLPATAERYAALTQKGEPVTTGDDVPYFSFSSMSPVLAGFCALLLSLRPTLTAAECKEILISTSYAITETGPRWYDINPCPRVVDIGKAIKFVL